MANSAPWVAAGLGNPGKKYERTRHNAGARTIDVLAGIAGVKLRKSKMQAHVADVHAWSDRCLLVRPTTYMNESGNAVAPALRWFKVPPERLIVVHDDIDLPTGRLRVKFGGGNGGHHGLDSISRSLGSGDFYRVRIGVGRPESSIQDEAEFVIDSMSPAAARELATWERRAAEAVVSLIERGLEATMNEYNAR